MLVFSIPDITIFVFFKESSSTRNTVCYQKLSTLITHIQYFKMLHILAGQTESLLLRIQK